MGGRFSSRSESCENPARILELTRPPEIRRNGFFRTAHSNRAGIGVSHGVAAMTTYDQKWIISFNRKYQRIKKVHISVEQRDMQLKNVQRGTQMGHEAPNSNNIYLKWAPKHKLGFLGAHHNQK